MLTGRILAQHGIKVIDDKKRIDISEVNEGIDLTSYHYRFKSEDRFKDAENMYEFHKLLYPVPA